MTTFGEMIYAVLDLLKERSDDAYYTEDHVLFILKKMRALLIERKYKGGRNAAYSPMSEENRQQICLQLEPADGSMGSCDSSWLRSVDAIPETMAIASSVTCTGHDLLETAVTFVSPERMRYVGYNKWLKNIIYASRSIDGHLYLHGSNPQFKYLEMAGLTGVFADPEEAAKLSHKACETGKCDIMEERFPLEAGLVASCIELTAQELLGSRFSPEDKNNNARDDFGQMGISQNSASKPAESTEQQQEAQ